MMKQGRDLFAHVIASQGGVAPAIRKLKGRQLAALIHYAEGLGDEDGPNDIIGTAVIVAAERYFAKTAKKAAKKARRAKRIL